jgi:hypothetical protein
MIGELYKANCHCWVFMSDADRTPAILDVNDICLYVSDGEESWRFFILHPKYGLVLAGRLGFDLLT